MKHLTLIATCVALLSLPVVASAEEPAAGFVGVLEDRAPPGQSFGPRLRATFQHSPPAWTALLTIGRNKDKETENARMYAATPAQTKWTVCANGRVAREGIATPIEKVDSWGDVGTQKIALHGQVPWGSPVGTTFSGPGESGGHRPLIATTLGRCKDPDGWAPTTFKAKDLKLLMTPLQRVTMGMKMCTPDGMMVPIRPFEGEVTVRQAFRAKDGRQIVQLVPRPKQADLGPCPGRTRSSYARLFLLNKDGQPHFLGVGTTFVDAVDVDGDGHSEVLGWYNDGPFEGYTLYFDGLKGSARALWPMNDEAMALINRDNHPGQKDEGK